MPVFYVCEMKLKYNLGYFVASIIIFFIEVLIATKLKNQFFIRAYLGDVIVVILLYTLVLSFFEIKNKLLLIAGIFAFSCLIEFAQYFHIAEKMGFQKGSLMYIVIGNSFAWEDILCYGIGCLLLYIFTKLSPQQ